ncbi:hypothetical protein [Halomonas rhizosphaerae]|uniref:DUF892 family protein n=1 Tax=Halomonas rhizosphaerae TaxID=3043296 RepID=A0ABT6V153_9GAMM|nr:hypothetical protein [Halomonas rhizosphaerae]MDI5891530.1 hypothetical protein [Halomonas rhizosphaerae]MDI5919843.1 hypothetical protein [Halomonas rhizosphaerae]
MHTIPTSATPRLLPEELLGLASDHERDELERYRGLAFRFLAFSSATSRLMAALGIECEMRLAGLARAACRLGLDEPRGDAATRLAAPAVAPPVLVDSLKMARDALSQAMADAAASRRFYARLGEVGAASSLGHEFVAIARQKQAELAILREHCLESGAGQVQRRRA